MGVMPGGVPWANVFHFVGDTLSTTEQAAVHAALRQFYSGLRPQLNADWKHEKTRFAIRDSTTGQWPTVAETVQTPADAGTAAGAPVPNDMAVCVTWQSGQLTRRGRGRTFLGGWAVNAISEAAGGHAIVSSTVVNLIVTAADALHNSPGAGPLGIWSEADLALHPVLRGSVGNLWDTQRRRERGLVEVRTHWS